MTETLDTSKTAGTDNKFSHSNVFVNVNPVSTVLFQRSATDISSENSLDTGNGVEPFRTADTPGRPSALGGATRGEGSKPSLREKSPSPRIPSIIIDRMSSSQERLSQLADSEPLNSNTYETQDPFQSLTDTTAPPKSSKLLGKLFNRRNRSSSSPPRPRSVSDILEIDNQVAVMLASPTEHRKLLKSSSNSTYNPPPNIASQHENLRVGPNLTMQSEEYLEPEQLTDAVNLKYIKTQKKSSKQQEKLLKQIFLAQELNPNTNSNLCNLPHDSNQSTASSVNRSRRNSYQQNAIWCAKFSKDGKYLATAGQDSIIRVWKVLASPVDRIGYYHPPRPWSDDISMASDDWKPKAYAPVFLETPIKIFTGHTADVLCLSWSKNNFLLSASMDKTAKLWHVERSECLHTFLHDDFVTSIEFHPKDDRFFVSGSLDFNLRLWSILDKNVAFIKSLPDLITVVTFTPDGNKIITGLFHGMCYIFETIDLIEKFKFQVKSSHGKNSKGSKVTGIEAFTPNCKKKNSKSTNSSSNDIDDELKLLISTNDSRIRLYNVSNTNLEVKYKGHINNSSQNFATISDDLKYIVSGSEDECTYIWKLNPIDDNNKDTSSLSTNPLPNVLTNNRKIVSKDYEYFKSHSSKVTFSIFAPLTTRRVLAISGDPIYEMLNNDLNPAIENYNNQEPSSTNIISSQSLIHDRTSIDGGIIITGDESGLIRVFRQDCCYSIRKKINELKKLNNRKSKARKSLSIRSRSRSNSNSNQLGSQLQQTVTDSSLRNTTILPSPLGHRYSYPNNNTSHNSIQKPSLDRMHHRTTSNTNSSPASTHKNSSYFRDRNTISRPGSLMSFGSESQNSEISNHAFDLTEMNQSLISLETPPGKYKYIK